MQSTGTTPFYARTWFAWLMSFIFFPIGLVLFWYYKHHSIIIRSVITMFWIVVFFTSTFITVLNKTNEPASSNKNSNQVQVTKKEEKKEEKKPVDKSKAQQELQAKTKLEIIKFAKALELQFERGAAIENDRKSSINMNIRSKKELGEYMDMLAMRWASIEKEANNLFIPSDINKEDMDSLKNIKNTWIEAAKKEQVAYIQLREASFTYYTSSESERQAQAWRALMEKQKNNADLADKKIGETISAYRDLLKKHNIDLKVVQ